MPGVEFHANMIDGLIQGKTLISQSSASVWLFAIILAVSLIAVFYFVGTGWAIGVLLLVILTLIIIGRRLIVGYDEGIVINLFFYLVISGVAFIGTYIYKFLIVDRNKRYIEGAFGRYISPDVVKEISENTQALELGGANRRIAVFFSDIANFTTVSESLGTEKIFTLLGEYLSAMTDILVENRGTLDKYIGDAVMGFF
jgi:adenylate cyclase